jgi:phage FluMu protein Com
VVTVAKSAKARIKCPYCNKTGVRITIKTRGRGTTGVTATIRTHDGMLADPKTGKNLRCTGSGKQLANRLIPPMSTWE